MVMATLTAGLLSGANATTRRRPAALEKRAWWAGRQQWRAGQGGAGEQRQGVLRSTRDLSYQKSIISDCISTVETPCESCDIDQRPMRISTGPVPPPLPPTWLLVSVPSCPIAPLPCTQPLGTVMEKRSWSSV